MRTTAGHRVLMATAISASCLGLVSLLAPWVRVGAAGKSTIELIATAGALDVLTGWVKVIVVVVWASAPVLGGIALLVFASGRNRMGAVLLLVVGLLLALPAALLVTTFRQGLAWGALAGGLCGVLSIGASLGLIYSTTQR